MYQLWNARSHQKKIPKISGLEIFVYLAPSCSNRPSPHSRSSDDSHPEQIWERTETNRGRYNRQHYQQIKWCKDFFYQQFYQPKLKQCHYLNPGKKSFQKWWHLHPFLHPEKKKKLIIAWSLFQPSPLFKPAQRLAVKVDSTVTVQQWHQRFAESS